MLVNCKCHGLKIDRDTAFKVVVKKANNYYCSEADYLAIVGAKQGRKENPALINQIAERELPHNYVSPNLKEIHDKYGVIEVNKYLHRNLHFLKRRLENKEFRNDYALIKYLFVIIKAQMAEENKPPVVIECDIDMTTEINYKPRKRKPSLDEYEDGDDEI